MTTDDVKARAEAGELDAMNQLGTQLMEQGRVDEAETWYARAAQGGLASGMYNLGLWQCRQGGDHAEAEAWWHRAADAGQVRSMVALADTMLSRGDAEGAEPWYQRAADEDDAEAAFGLAVLHADRDDTKAALAWYERAADGGDPRAMCNLAVHHAHHGDPDTEIYWWRRAAEASNTKAAYNLAVCLAGSNVTEAQRWYRQAAEAGHTGAATNLGVLLAEQGDLINAEPWLKQAAEAWDASGMSNYAVLLRITGRETEANTLHELARFWHLVQSLSWDEIEFARPGVRSGHVEALVQLYWTLDNWPPRVALVQLVQDQNHPALKPIMLDILRAPVTPERDLVELTKAAALRLIDTRYDTFMKFYEDRAALHAAVRDVLEAHGLNEE
ncbi:tetratricopeptide repeat protein [Streptomyces sp. NPDC052013]|uniref:tetratricopeptide repeat protein n=1 Tax=Streptomyces sp. NPDC052013 TaxID=3365679 RepID=UPI0037CDEB86